MNDHEACVATLLKYKGYQGSVEFDEENMIFYGKVQSIRELISYEAKNAKELIDSFRGAVDEYLEDSQVRRSIKLSWIQARA